MTNNIIETVKEYKELSLMIEAAAVNANIEENISIDEALLRLFYIKSLECKLDDCQEQLSQETDEETLNAVFDAAETIQTVSDMVFEQIEHYALDDRKFEIVIENTTVDLQSKDKRDLLNQLYKCEGIIRMAEKAASRFPLYGGGSRRLEHLEGIENEGGKSPEEKVFDELGIDIYELQGIREKLVLILNKITG